MLSNLPVPSATESPVAGQRNRRRDGTRLRVNRGRAPRSAVEGEDPPRFCVVADRIRVLAGRRRADRLQRLEIEDRHVVAAAVADEPAVQLRRDRNTVDTGRLGYVADHFVRVEIDDHDVRRVR
jgi:hypothetical protein